MSKKSFMACGLLALALATPLPSFAEETDEKEEKSGWDTSAQLLFLTQYVGSGGYHYSANRPAVQGIVDVWHTNGFWAELWTSSVAGSSSRGGVSNTAGMEIDLMLGIQRPFPFAKTLSYFVTYGYYYFPKTVSEPSNQKGSHDLEAGVKWQFIPSTAASLSFTRDLQPDWDLFNGNKNGAHPGTSVNGNLYHDFGHEITARVGVSYYRPDGYDSSKGMKDKLRWFIRAKKTFANGKYFVDVRYIDTDRNEKYYGPALIGTVGVKF